MKGGLKKTVLVTVLSGALLPVILLLGGCRMLFDEPIIPDPLAGGMGRLSVAVSGSQAAPVANPGRTMLAVTPEFSRYELVVSPNPDTLAAESSKSYYSDTGSFQLILSPANYVISAIGYTGDKRSAQTWDSTARVIETKEVAVTPGAQTEETLTLRPYMDAETYGTLQYSINWDGVGQIPTQAELLIEQYAGDDVWNPIPVSLITGDASAGSRRGTVLLLQRAAGLVKQAGSLPLPPGEYRLTATVTMDGPWPPVSRSDIAHIYSNLITPAAFFYGAGDLTVTNPGLDTASGFITRFNFKKPNESAEIAITSVVGSAPGPDGTRLIMVMVPAGTLVNPLIPVVECAPGAEVTSPAPTRGPDNIPFWSSGNYTHPTFWTATGANGVSQQYTVVVSEAPPGDAILYSFVFDGYPDYPGTVTQPPSGETSGSITVLLPNGALLAGLKPLILYKGKLSPASGEENDFSGSSTTPVNYTVTSEDDSATITYPVTVLTQGPDTDTGIFDFVITNVPRAKVVIGTKPRATDGKIPIVIQVPYATEPLTSSGDMTDLSALIPRITLSSSNSSITFPDLYADGQPLPFNNTGNYQEAIYTVTAQAGNTQDYAVIIARDVHYYYVKATGSDSDADSYNGASESTPFKTLAHAVARSLQHDVDHIFVIGTLNDTSEGGAYEDTSAKTVSFSDAFNTVFITSGGGSISNGGGASVFNIKGTGIDSGNPRHIYITGVGSNAVLQGTSGKRVISITGGAHITFENITIQGGGGPSYAGNGGGLYVGDHSKVVWKSGVITGNTAKSGGGVYLDVTGDTTGFEDDSEFDFMSGSINGNTTNSSAITRADFEDNNIKAVSIAGGGGVYVNGDALFWQAGGEINGNTAAGSGGGVLVNGATVPSEPTALNMPHNFIMSGGVINSNTSNANAWPGGGGGVYVAKGAFEMLNGAISHNNAPLRQGGGVFVWSRALFYMGGNSSVTLNNGVGSSKAICSRGITRMEGNAQADSVYIWNYAKPTNPSEQWNNTYCDEFTLMGGARISGLVLAFADDPNDNRNYINIVEGNDGKFFTEGTDRITTIDLESHLLSNGSFAKDATIAGDWVNKFLIKNAGNAIPAEQAANILKRFPLGTFTYGGATQGLSAYRLDNTGKLQR
jgi:hypothetical protein